MRTSQLTLISALTLALGACGNSNNSSGATGTSASANSTASVAPKPAVISAKHCVNPALSKVGSVLITTTRTSSTEPAFTNESTVETTFIGRSTFEGVAADERKLKTTNAGVVSTILFYSNDDDGTLVELGSTTNNAVGGFKVATKTVLSPAFRDSRYTLNAGESFKAARVGTTTATTTGLPIKVPPTVTQLNDSFDVTFVAIEPVTVPAGTFQACRFENRADANNVITEWVATNGVLVKSTQTKVSTELISASINGVAMRP